MQNPPISRPRPRLANLLSAVRFGALLAFAATVASAATYNVRDFGARGDGTTLDSDAINRAIDAASAAGGGTVTLPTGSYLSYTVRLQSHITLVLEAGATLIAAEPPPAGEPGGYDAAEPNPWHHYQDFGHSHWRNSLIWGENLEDVSILGPGRIYGRGLSRGTGRTGRPVGATPPPMPNGRLPDVLSADGPASFDPRPDLVPGPFGYPSARDTRPDGVGNKAIALKNCRNVILRDFSMLHGGHFAILATGVDNLTIDNLTIDTNRDGMDVDACVNVRISNCIVNSPWDDGICLKSSHGLGYARITENVTITHCIVSGFDEGTVLDGTRQSRIPRRGGPMGRIKLGTEAGGGFRNITIANCVFDHCRGLALEQVDGGVLEDITVTNLTMREVSNAPIFIRLGARLRRPETTTPGIVRRILIHHVVASQVAATHGIFIAGLPDHPIKAVSLSDIQIHYAGGGTAADASREFPEMPQGYPEPELFGVLPAWGLYARHVSGLRLRGLEFTVDQPDARPAITLDDATDIRASDVILPTTHSAAPWSLRSVQGFTTRDVSGLADGPQPDAAPQS